MQHEPGIFITRNTRRFSRTGRAFSLRVLEFLRLPLGVFDSRVRPAAGEVEPFRSLDGDGGLSSNSAGPTCEGKNTSREVA